MAQECLLDIKRLPVEQVVGGLLAADDPAASSAAGARLVRTAIKFGLDVKDYLTLAVETRGTQYSDLSGYELAKVFLKLPTRDDFKEGVLLQAASDTFQTYPGTRILFPPVIDDMLYWTRRMDRVEQIAPILAGSRTVAGAELIWTVVDEADSTEYKSFVVPEGSKIPIRSIRTHENNVRMYKHGSGIRTTYEFNRRARLDMLTPFAARVARELELSKIASAIGIIINGDGSVTGPAPLVTQASYNTAVGGTAATTGTLSYRHLLYWLVQRAKAMVPVDTVIGNWDAYYQWMGLFAPTINSFRSGAEAIAGSSPWEINNPNIFPGPVNFVVTSAVPAGVLIGISRNETVEELREAGGDIAEEERAVLNQTITYIRSEVTGYRLLYTDTRSVYDYISAS